MLASSGGRHQPWQTHCRNSPRTPIAETGCRRSPIVGWQCYFQIHQRSETLQRWRRSSTRTPPLPRRLQTSCLVEGRLPLLHADRSEREREREREKQGWAVDLHNSNNSARGLVRRMAPGEFSTLEKQERDKKKKSDNKTLECSSTSAMGCYGAVCSLSPAAISLFPSVLPFSRRAWARPIRTLPLLAASDEAGPCTCGIGAGAQYI